MKSQRPLRGLDHLASAHADAAVYKNIEGKAMLTQMHMFLATKKKSAKVISISRTRIGGKKKGKKAFVFCVSDQSTTRFAEN